MINCFPLFALRSAWKSRDESGEAGKKISDGYQRVNRGAESSLRDSILVLVEFLIESQQLVEPACQLVGIVGSSFARGKCEISGGTILVLRHRMLPRTFPTTSSPF